MEPLPKHAEVVNAFLRTGDILSAKALVQEHYDVFVTSESVSYLRKLKSTYRNDPSALAVLDDCLLVLSRCRYAGIHVAFAENFRRLKPVPISETAAAALAPVWGSREQVEHLAASRPDLVPEIQQAMVGAVLLADLLAAPQFATVQSRVLSLRAALLLIDQRLDAKMWADAMLLLADTLLEQGSDEATADRVSDARSILETLFDSLSQSPGFGAVRDEVPGFRNPSAPVHLRCRRGRHP